MQVEAFGLIDTAQIDPLLSIFTGRLIDVLKWPSPNLHHLDGRDRNGSEYLVL